MSRVRESEVTVAELLSEVWIKLLSSVSVDDQSTSLKLEDWSINHNSPELDGRVIWLISEIGGSEALAHRHEDIRRQRHGRFVPGRGRPIVQPDGDEELESIDALEPPMEVDDVARLAWFGLIKIAEGKFPQDDDVSVLLQLFNEASDLFDEAATGQWPMKDIVSRLNVQFQTADWHVDRVENAKRRLTRWVKGLMKTLGLDQTDFEALLVQVAKKVQCRRSSKGGQSTRLSS
jgi:hypothetical protein